MEISTNTTILLLVIGSFSWMFVLSVLFGGGIQTARAKGYYTPEWAQQNTWEWLVLVITPSLLAMFTALALAIVSGGEV